MIQLAKLENAKEQPTIRQSPKESLMVVNETCLTKENTIRNQMREPTVLCPQWARDEVVGGQFLWKFRERKLSCVNGQQHTFMPGQRRGNWLRCCLSQPHIGKQRPNED